MDFEMTVLVAEDFATMRKIICNFLREMGFKHVLEAEDGLAAWEIIQGEPIGLLVTDWQMPRMGGLELVQKIRENPGTASLAVLMVTIEELGEHILQAVQAGVNQYLIKPFNAGDLAAKIQLIFDKIPPEPRRRPGPACQA